MNFMQYCVNYDSIRFTQLNRDEPLFQVNNLFLVVVIYQGLFFTRKY